MQLKSFANNLDWDKSLIMTIMSISFCELGDLSFTVKKGMLLEIKNVIEEYKNMPDKQKSVETYD